MKEQITKLVCDKCSTQTEIPENQEYPYHRGWAYIHKMDMKLPIKTTHRLEGVANGHDGFEQTNNHDKHFCSIKCLTEYFMDIISLVEPIKQPTNMFPNPFKR